MSLYGPIKVLRKISETKTDTVKKNLRKVHDEKLHNLY